MLTSPNPVYLNVPYAEREKVKALGAKWDVDTKRWYVKPGHLIKPFTRWLSEPAPVEQSEVTVQQIPYHEPTFKRAWGKR
jgi:hypothetical protein